MAIRSTPIEKLAVVLVFLTPLLLSAQGTANDALLVGQFTRATQAWGQAIIDQKLRQVQDRLMADARCRYEYRLAQNTVYAMEQAELVARIETTPPEMMVAQNDTLAVVCPRAY